MKKPLPGAAFVIFAASSGRGLAGTEIVSQEVVERQAVTAFPLPLLGQGVPCLASKVGLVPLLQLAGQHLFPVAARQRIAEAAVVLAA